MLNVDFNGIKKYLSDKSYDIDIENFKINPSLVILKYALKSNTFGLIDDNGNIERFHVPFCFVEIDDSFKELLSLYEFFSKTYFSKKENDYVITVSRAGYTINPRIINSPTGNCQIASISYLNYIRTEFDSFNNLTPLQKKYWFSLFILHISYSFTAKRLFYFDTKISESLLTELLGESEIITSSTITTTNGSIMKTGIILC